MVTIYKPENMVTHPYVETTSKKTSKTSLVPMHMELKSPVDVKTDLTPRTD